MFTVLHALFTGLEKNINLGNIQTENERKLQNDSHLTLVFGTKNLWN